MIYNKINGQHFLSMVANASIRLENEKSYVDSLNVFPVPDGDTGTNMSMTFKAAVKAIESNNSTSIGEVSKVMAKGALMGARGNSGVILSQIFRGIAKGLEGKDEVNSYEFSLSLLEGSKAAYRAVMRPTEGTILTVIREVGENAVEYHTDNVSDLMRNVTEVAGVSLEKTPDLLPQLKAAGVVDSGGMGLLIILKGMYEALETNFVQAERKEEVSFDEYVAARDTDTEITFGYCTEFIVLAEPDNGEFKTFLESMGDSIVYVGYDDITKVHIHTDNPGLVLEEAAKRGELTKIKIENMREQHRNLQEVHETPAPKVVELPKKNEPKEKYAFISVSMGEGIEEIFTDLGVKHVVSGGQTMNPSTEDIINAVEEINAEHIIILPNNKNIIMAANQAKEISSKDVYVIPTKSIPQGIAALTAFNSEAGMEENYDAIMKSLESVKSGSITYAVRNTEVDGKEIKQGDYLGLVEGKIKEVKRELYPLLEDLLEEMVDEESSSITLIYGQDVNEEEFLEVFEKLEEKYPDLDVMNVDGKQPLYYFIIAVE